MGASPAPRLADSLFGLPLERAGGLLPKLRPSERVHRAATARRLLAGGRAGRPRALRASLLDPMRAVLLLPAAALLPLAVGAGCSLASLPAGSLTSVSSACGSAVAACTTCFPEVLHAFAGVQSSAEGQACVNTFVTELQNAGAAPATLALLPSCTALGTANGVQLLPCPINLTSAAASPLASSCASSSDACRGCMGATKTALLDAGLDPQLDSSLILNRAQYIAVQSCSRSFMPLLLSAGVPAATLMALRSCPVPPTQYVISSSLTLGGVRAADVSTTALALSVTKILGAVSGQVIVTGSVDAGARRSLLSSCTVALSMDADTAAQQTRFQTALSASVSDGSLLRELASAGVPATSLALGAVTAAAATTTATGHGMTPQPTPAATVSAAGTPAADGVDNRVVAGAVAGSIAGSAPLVALAAYIVLRRHRAHTGRASNTGPLLADASTGSTKAESSPSRSGAATPVGSDRGDTPSIILTTDTDDSERGWTAVVSTADEVELGELLGAGGFATVYAAVWRGSTVAVKLFDQAALELTPSESSASASQSGVSWPTVPDLAGSDGTRAREVSRERTFMQEVSMLSKIRHPNVLAVYALVNSPRMLIMELAPGGSLRALLARLSLEQLSWAARVRVLTGIAAGVEFLHTQGIIHFDLKSDNVLLMQGAGADMVPKVADFSISARKGAAGGLASAGTPAYMAPEVARGELVQDLEAVDCYGFGCIVHDTAHVNTGGPGVVLGEAASSSASLNGIQVLIKRELAGYERVVSPHVPAALAALTSACLAVCPAARPRLAAARVQLAGMQQEANTW